MQRVVIDTNVLVSSLIQRSYPYYIISELFINGKIELCISDPVMQEYHDVLNRKRFSKYPDFLYKAETLLADIEIKSSLFFPKNKLKVMDDADDNKFLELAAESKAHFLVTGNTNDFTMSNFKKTKIVTPKEYWERFQGK